MGKVRRSNSHNEGSVVRREVGRCNSHSEGSIKVKRVDIQLKFQTEDFVKIKREASRSNAASEYGRRTTDLIQGKVNRSNSHKGSVKVKREVSRSNSHDNGSVKVSRDVSPHSVGSEKDKRKDSWFNSHQG